MNLKASLLDDKAIKRSLIRISHEIIERNKGATDLILVGIKSRGYPLAERISKEIFKIVLLNTKNEIITDIDISIGTLNSSLVHPREVFREAIRRSSNKIILIHNHPSGCPTPSAEDKVVTNRLVKCGDIIGIEVIDHIIIGDGLYFSFKENMLI